jgi:uncharacterized membrane protein
VLSWGIAFRVRQYLKGSLWLVPLAGALIGAIGGPIGIAIDAHFGIPGRWEYTPSTATTLLASIIGASAALAGFVVTVSVLVVQIAIDSLSSRYMRLWFRDPMLKATLAVLLGTLTFALQALRRIKADFVPDMSVTIAEGLLVIGVLLFLLFLDRALHLMRPVAVAAVVAASIRRSAEDAARAAASADRPDFVVGEYKTGAEPELVIRSNKAGALQAVDTQGLVRFARGHDCLIVFLHAVGDFISVGAPVFEVYGTGESSPVIERRLLSMIALGNERTIDQDPAFGIRVMVDIANLALSPAVNDPTTAVQVLDHLGETLRMMGNTDLATEGVRSSGARPLVIIPTRSWDDIVTLAVTEIREYGARSIQVSRRLRAMLESVRDSVPAGRRPAIEEELARLDRSVAVAFAGSVDLDRATNADPQGIGGRLHAHHRE